MSVYVDNAQISYGRMIMCHMVADNLRELHAMADRIGLGRCWFHRGHYNICLQYRAKAVRAGAVEITSRHAVLLRRKLEDAQTSSDDTSLPRCQRHGDRSRPLHSDLCPLSHLSTGESA